MDRRQFVGQVLGTAVAGCLGERFVLADDARLKWQTSLKTGQKVALDEKKLLLVVFGASWCTFCHKLERETLADKRIVSLVEREFVPVHLDFDRETRVAKLLEVEQLPATVVLSPQADLLLHLVGYLDAKSYEKSLMTALQKRADIAQARQTTIVK
jgi:uncharacterized protein YyaL (SSP411 family)